MKKINEKSVNPAELALILGISIPTVKYLAKIEELPCTYYNRQPMFNLSKIIERISNIEGSAA